MFIFRLVCLLIFIGRWRLSHGRLDREFQHQRCVAQRLGFAASTSKNRGSLHHRDDRIRQFDGLRMGDAPL